MPIVNYVREHTRFIEYACDEKLTSSERLLWYALMHCMNQRAEGRVWPEDFIRIDNKRLLSLCPMKFDTLASARNSLKQRGRIDFVPGSRNKTAPGYKMIYFYPEDDGGYPKKPDNNGYNPGGNTGYNQGYNPGYNRGDIYINNTIHQPNHFGMEDEETINNRYRSIVRGKWVEAFGREPARAAVELIEYWANRIYRVEAEVACEAVYRSALRDAEDPVAYAVKLIRDWGAHGVKTSEDVERYLEDV